MEATNDQSRTSTSSESQTSQSDQSFEIISDIDLNFNLNLINGVFQHYVSGKADDNSGSYQDITRTHWKPKSAATKCSNEACPKHFRIFEPGHHCRKCGEVFCNACLAYKKRLNYLAQPDPCGNWYRVCEACLNEGPQGMGQLRNWNEDLGFFHNLKKTAPAEATAKNDTDQDAVRRKMTVSVFRENFDMDAECQRIKAGFKSSLQDGFVGKVLRDYLPAKKHNWKKSSCVVLRHLPATCYSCGQAFGLGKLRHTCVLCCSSVCVMCSSKDLIVYIPDELRTQTNKEIEASLSIIRIVGCPATEPETCMYLRICVECHSRMKEKQVAEYHGDRKASGVSLELAEDCAKSMEEIQEVHENLQTLRERIEVLLPFYEELVDFCASRAISSPPAQLQHEGNMEALAKFQGDLSDSFTQFTMTLLTVKKIRACTKSQGVILRNILTSSSDYCHQNIFAFRTIQRRLDAEIAVLSTIRKEVDRNAINGCYLTIRQLVLEVLHFSGRYHVQEALLDRLLQLEAVALSDLRTVITEDPNDPKCTKINEFLEEQIKSHRFIVAPNRLVASQGAKYVGTVVAEKTATKLEELILQLKEKCADDRFKATRKKLNSLKQWLELEADVQPAEENEQE